MSEELKPCPFCGETPDLPSGDGTQYEIECGSCGMAMASVQISDFMTIEERKADPFTNYRYAEQFIDRAKAEAINQWNTRATPPAAQLQGERGAFEATNYDHSKGLNMAAAIDQGARWVDEYGAPYRLCPAVGNLQILVVDYGRPAHWADAKMTPAHALTHLSPLSTPPAADHGLMDGDPFHNDDADLSALLTSVVGLLKTGANQDCAELFMRDLKRVEQRLAAPPAAGVPEGWKLVPIKPTAEMKAVCRVAGKTKVWADMIAASPAAPTPPASEQKQAVVLPKIDGTALVEVVNGAEGPSLYIGNEDGGYRLAGPKPWGGGRTIHKFTVKLDELVREAMDLAGVNQGVTTVAVNGGEV
ncbi:Lar family restriction alleviation protein [Pseudomonas tohonis]|nr:Lar family restriction alleviation protein [Pseudomonas tohonis]